MALDVYCWYQSNKLVNILIAEMDLILLILSALGIGNALDLPFINYTQIVFTHTHT